MMCEDSYSLEVHKVTLLIVDHDKLGPKEIKDVLENTKFPNHCMHPEVMDTQTRTVEWTDSHPLNMHATAEQAFKELFEEQE